VLLSSPTPWRVPGVLVGPLLLPMTLLMPAMYMRSDSLLLALLSFSKQEAGTCWLARACPGHGPLRARRMGLGFEVLLPSPKPWRVPGVLLRPLLLLVTLPVAVM
jgi:hypothetical protein